MKNPKKQLSLEDALSGLIKRGLYHDGEMFLDTDESIPEIEEISVIKVVKLE